MFELFYLVLHAMFVLDTSSGVVLSLSKTLRLRGCCALREVNSFKFDGVLNVFHRIQITKFTYYNINYSVTCHTWF